jgi:NDP-sugar pyrophosphorylase family protein
LADQIEDECGDGQAWEVAIEYSKEEQPLGTAGAVKQAHTYLQDVSEFLVMNGDSFLEIDFRSFIDFHRRHKAMATMAVLRVEDASRYGTVDLDGGSRVKSFAEKTGKGIPGLVNGGIYVFSAAVFGYIPESPASIERDVFPRLLAHGVYAQEQHGMFIDIGTPSDYARAQQLCDSLNEAASRGRLPDTIGRIVG